MRVLIVDDEPIARRGIRHLLKVHPDADIVGEARNGKEAVERIESLAPDVVFLDVQMPEMDGFETLRRVNEDRLPSVIFVTAFDEFAVRAFETHALDYLVKPVHEDRFHRTLARVRERLKEREALALSRRLSGLLSRGGALSAPSDSRQRILIPGAAGDVVVEVNDIDWIEANDYYAAVHVRGKRHLLRESLQSLEQRLDPASFVRVHRSAIVNLASVSELRSRIAGASVVLKDGTKVPLSRRRKERTARALRRFTGTTQLRT